ncbi:hypothetical protein V5T82_12035 [Magnetovibrio sp. PR-2]|uniref:hypothetical protein n=1 Tax=Magnetovibrio sp. PR-2 TaxID=3120356 RepID=UPI002FCE6317
MSFYKSLPNDRPQTWFDEFRAEVISDHRQLLACREERADKSNWSFGHAVKRTQEFYQDRLNGYQGVGSITAEQRDGLLALVDSLGTPEFEEKLKTL